MNLFFKMVVNNWDGEVPLWFTLIYQQIMTTCWEAALQVIKRPFWFLFQFDFSDNQIKPTISFNLHILMCNINPHEIKVMELYCGYDDRAILLEIYFAG